MAISLSLAVRLGSIFSKKSLVLSFWSFVARTRISVRYLGFIVLDLWIMTSFIDCQVKSSG